MTAPADRDALVELVARAMAIANGKDPDAPAWIRYPGGHTEGICWRDQYAKKARATLTAMEAAGCVVVPVEATDEMSMDGVVAYGDSLSAITGNPTDSVCSSRDTGAAYCAMLANSPYRVETV